MARDQAIRPLSIEEARAALLADDDESRGRIAVSDAVVLFHFVEPQVVAARPELPLAARQGILDGLDWKTTCIAAFSFLFHFGALGAAYSDFADTTIQDDGVWVTQAPWCLTHAGSFEQQERLAA